MKILVTGGAGYIGSHAVRQLVKDGHEVSVLDNLSHGNRAAIDRGAHFVRGGVEDAALLERIFLAHDCEAVMHFAADIEVGESVADPYKYYLNNFAHPLSMLDTMRRCGIKILICSSTAAVYGIPMATPIDETHPLNPINPYGRAKMMLETAIEDFRSAHGLGYAILRYFNVAGASPDASIGEDHEPESHLIPRVLDVACGRSDAIAVFGTDYPTRDGTCIRDYVHVEDLVGAHVMALASVKPGEGRVYNLGSENGFTVMEVIKACEKITGRRIPILERVRRPGDPAALVASSAKIRNELNWTRDYPDLENMIAHAWKWHLKKINPGFAGTAREERTGA